MYIIVFILLLIAWLCRIGRSGNVRGIIRCSIQCGLLTTWAYFVGKRIINKRVRRHLISIAVLYLLWTIEVMIKYTVLFKYPILNRYAWYLYYIPMTIVPVLLIYISLYVDKPLDYKINKRLYLLLIPSFISILLVLTNNFHQLVFTFPNGVEIEEGYKQTIGYFIIMGIVVLEICFFIIRLVKKCRIGNKAIRTVFPLIPLIILFIYGVLYIIDYDIIAKVAGDMKSVNVYSVVFTLEICIMTGLLPSNTKYEELFLTSSLSSIITNNDYTPILASNNALTLSKTQMEMASNEPFKLDNNKYLFSMPISVGNVLWVEDVSEISKIVSELEELDKELEGKNLVLQEENKTNRRRQSLIEKNRLYNQMQKQSIEKILILKQLIKEMNECNEPLQLNIIISKIAVITAYLKRRNNIIFISEENGVIQSSELTYCLKESLSNLAFFNGTCDFNINLNEQIKFIEISTIYDKFELVVEKIMTNFKEVYVFVSNTPNSIILRMSIVCDIDLSELSLDGFEVVRESDNEWSVEYQCFNGDNND